MDALGELAGGVLELLLDFLPLRVTAAVCVNVAAAFFAAEWMAGHAASPARPWVSAGAWVVLPLASFALLLWPRAGRRR